MSITLITDCKDDNAKGRQTTRLSQLFNLPVNFIGVQNDLEAAGNLIDVLDACGGEEGAVLVNVAPRHKEAKRWGNGTPFGFFYYKKTLIISSIDGLTLSLIKKFSLVKEINLMDIPKVLSSLLKKNIIDKNLSEHIKHTQFRSFEFLPRVARWIIDGIQIPYQKISIDSVANAPKAIWWVDNFGNCKTTLTQEDLDPAPTINTKIGDLKFYQRLKDVPDDETAIIIGSSGVEDKRFMEIVVQGKSAAKHFGIEPATII